MSLTRLTCCALLLSLPALLSADAPVVQATRAERAPTLDGKLDDPCWTAAKAATAFLINNTDTPAQFGSSAMVAYDDAALYVAVRCEEPNVADLQTRPLPRDDNDVFRTDCVEIMLDPERSQNEYYHLGINASGSVADRVCTQGGYIGDWSWDASVTAAAFVGDKFWSCEIAIPFYSLGISPKVGSTWRINVCREKKKPAENSSLAEQGAFNIASRFAELRGLDADLSRYCYVFGPLQANKVIKEGQLDLSLAVPVFNGTGKAEQRLLDGWLISPSGKVVAAKAAIQPPVDKEQIFTLGPLRLTEQGEYTCSVRVADPVTKKPLAVRQTPLAIEYVPLTIRLVEPWYRSALFATQNLDKVVLDVQLSMEAAALQATTLEVRVSEAEASKALAGTAIAEVKTTNRVTFDATSLPEATMRIDAVLKDRAGKPLVDTSHPLRKLPRKEGEVWLGQDLQWRVDGKPFFLNGAWNYPDDYVPDYNAFSGPRPEPGVKLLDTGIMNDLVHKTKSVRTGELSDEDAEFLRGYARQARDNPKLFAYYLSDEPEVANVKADVLERIYRIFAEEDPYHPVIISNDSMHGLHAYARCADINGLHPYPVILRDKPVNDLGSVAAFVEGAARAFADSPHKQTIAYLHQGFNYGDYGAVNNRIPTYVEYRNQDLLALICGANGSIQFNRMVAHYPELHLGMPHLTREFAYLGPIILSPTSATAPAADSDKVKLLLKEHEGQLYLLACNADMAPREVTLTIPGLGQRAKQLQVVPEGRSVPLAGDRLTDRFDTYEVHVYTTGPQPDLPTVKEIVAEIEQANVKRRKPGNLVFQEFEGDGVQVAASSSKAGGYRRPDTGLWHVVDGVIDKLDHYHCLTWQDTTDNEFPDWLEIKLPQAQRIGRVVVYPFEKSLKDYAVQVYVNGDWRDADKVTGQNADEITHKFAPVTTDRVRLFVTAANGPNSRVTEVEVYGK
jgi:hypothetical protein